MLGKDNASFALQNSLSRAQALRRGLGTAAPSGAGEGGWFGGRKPPLPSRGGSSLQDVLTASKREEKQKENVRGVAGQARLSFKDAVFPAEGVADKATKRRK